MLTWTGTQEHQRPAHRRARSGLAAATLGVLALAAGLRAQGPPPQSGPPKVLGAPRTSARDLIARRPDPVTLAPANADAGKNSPAPANAAPAEAPLAPPSPAIHLPIPPRPSVISAESSRYVKQVAGPDNILEVVVGRIQIFDLLGSPKRVQVGDESVANYVLMSTTELSLQGLRIGSTVLNVWFQDAADPNKSKLVSFLVRVLPDPDARNRLERAYKNLEKEINKVFLDSKVYLQLIGDKLAVCGQAKDIADAQMIMRMVNANVLPETADAPDLSRSATADPNNQIGRMYPAFHRQVVNMLRVPGEQQVMLQVQVVEVDRAAARSVGLNFGVLRNTGSFFIGGTTGNLGFTGQGAGGFANFGGGGLGLTGLGGLPNLPIAIDNGQIQLACLALRNLSYARYLAEPNLVTMNGAPANFQAGGLLPVPVIGGFGLGAGGNLAGVNFIPTGVQLQFTPFITERDRVRLTINAEISDRDLNVVPTLIDGAAVPSLITRNFATTVELREGQTLAVAGLIENKLDADSSKIPGWACIPVLSWLAGYSRIGNREKELVILVTPRLVHPMECNEVPPLPGLDILEPNDCEFYLLGRLESHIADYRSPIRTDCDRKKQARSLEQHFLFGASGPSVDLPPDASEKAAKPAEAHPPAANTPAPTNGPPSMLPLPPAAGQPVPAAPAPGAPPAGSSYAPRPSGPAR